MELPNGVLTEYAYDNLNRLTSLSHYNSADQLLAGFTYTLAPNGRRLGVHEQSLEPGNQYATTDISFTYDRLNRLTSESSTSSLSSLNYSNAYSYDLVGNRLEKRTAGNLPAVISYSYNSNDQLLRETSSLTGVTEYGYDPNGSLIQKTNSSESYGYVYNAKNQLASATIQRLENGQAVNISSAYAYNHAGIRVKADSTVNGITSNRIFLLDEMNHTGYAQILEETNNSSLVKSYVIGDDILSQSSISNSQFVIRNFLYDGHGSTRMLTDTTGGITSRYDYDAYGIMVGGNPNLANPAETDMLYSGEQFDADLQMQYLRARFYDQNTGRFISLDTFSGNNEDPQSLHKYAYTHCDPVNGIDPSGLENLLTQIYVTAINMELTRMSIAVAVTVKGTQRYWSRAIQGLQFVNNLATSAIAKGGEILQWEQRIQNQSGEFIGKFRIDLLLQRGSQNGSMQNILVEGKGVPWYLFGKPGWQTYLTQLSSQAEAFKKAAQAGTSAINQRVIVFSSKVPEGLEKAAEEVELTVKRNYDKVLWGEKAFEAWWEQ
jgi:RHS repeat-associated protein